MSHVVQQRRRPHDLLSACIDPLQRSAFFKQSQGHAGEMPRPQRVLEPGMCRARIDQKGETQLTHVSQTLHDRRFQQRQRQRIEADVVPERIAKNLHAERYEAEPSAGHHQAQLGRNGVVNEISGLRVIGAGSPTSHFALT